MINELRDELTEAVDEVWSDEFRFKRFGPASQYKAQTTPVEVFEARGVLITEPESSLDATGAVRTAGQRATRFAISAAEIRVDPRVYPQVLDLKPGDLAEHQPTGHTYEISMTGLRRARFVIECGRRP